jgi:beta-glucanase (GH16 family)
MFARLPARPVFSLLAMSALLAASALLAMLAGPAPAGADQHRDRAGVRTASERPKAIRHARVGLGGARAVSRRRVAATRSLNITTQSPQAGATLSGTVAWEVAVSGAAVRKVEFFVDGNLKSTQTSWPWQYGGAARGFDTTKFANGTHTLTTVAYGGRNVRNGRSDFQVTVDNPVANTASPNNTLVFSDDFEGAAGTLPNPAKWTAMNWCDRWGSLSCNTSRTKNVALDGQGNVRIRAIREGWTDPYGNTGSWTAGRLETQSKFSFTYGTIKARIKVPAGRGLWPSFWTTAATKTGWPATGEIDVMELLGHEPAAYYCSVHGANGSGHAPKTIRHNSSGSLASDYHVYEARWTPSKVDFFVDGAPCGTVSTNGLTPFAPQQLLVGMAVGGSWPGSPDSSTPSSADMLVDWVRAYS